MSRHSAAQQLFRSFPTGGMFPSGELVINGLRSSAPIKTKTLTRDINHACVCAFVCFVNPSMVPPPPTFPQPPQIIRTLSTCWRAFVGPRWKNNHKSRNPFMTALLYIHHKSRNRSSNIITPAAKKNNTSGTAQPSLIPFSRKVGGVEKGLKLIQTIQPTYRS